MLFLPEYRCRKKTLHLIFIFLHKIVFTVPLSTEAFHRIFFLIVIKTVGINDRLGKLAAFVIMNWTI